MSYLVEGDYRYIVIAARTVLAYQHATGTCGHFNNTLTENLDPQSIGLHTLFVHSGAIVNINVLIMEGLICITM